MKKIIASAGLIAVGTAGLHAAGYAPGLTQQEASKNWSVAASLQGFYDDNYASANANVVGANGDKLKQGSGGIEFRPSVAYNLPLERTYIGLSYEYGLKYYFDRVGDDIDQSHSFDGVIDHRFSDRYRLRLEDNLVYSQEPQLTTGSVGAGTYATYRSNLDSFRNNPSLKFTAQLTELLSVDVGYQNWFIDYKEGGDGSYSALLDRVMHRFNVDGMYAVRENTTALLGYAYQITDYTSKDLLAQGGTLRGDDRDATSHAIYVGGIHNFSPTLRGEVRAGAQYTDYSNDLFGSTWSPYVALAGSYSYLPGSYLQIGADVSRAATDVAGLGTVSNYATDQEAASIYALINHRISGDLTGRLMGRYQYGRFHGKGTSGDVAIDGAVDNYFQINAGLEYKINAYWAVQANYLFDRLDSDFSGRSFTRNQVFGGVRAHY